MLLAGIITLLIASALHNWYAANEAAYPGDRAVGYFTLGKLTLFASIVLLILGEALIYLGSSILVAGVSGIAYFLILPLLLLPLMQKVYVPAPKKGISESEWTEIAGLNDPPRKSSMEDFPIHAEWQAGLAARYKHGLAGTAKDPVEAVRWYRKAAEQGHADSQIALLECYFYGDEVPQDYDEAAYWAHKAAEQGNPYGQLWLGSFYDDGVVLQQDWKKAGHWYRKSAEAGFPNAKWRLGLLYRDGRGFQKDNCEACFWLSLALAEWTTDNTPLDDSYFINAEQVRSELNESERLAIPARINNWNSEHAPTSLMKGSLIV
jgi:hypothetical protein